MAQQVTAAAPRCAVRARMTARDSTVCLEFSSTFEMIDLVQVVSDHVCSLLRLDEDSAHWVGVAIRESVINAIKHGNGHDPTKVVSVVLDLTPAENPTVLTVRVRDQGRGFDPSMLADPLAPENLLKANGRGIFFMRSFMDSVDLIRVPGNGMEVRMVKRVVHPA